MAYTLILSVGVACAVLGKWDLSKGGLHYSTYRATVRRNGGPFTSGAHGLVDMNEALAKPVFDSIMASWDSVMNRKLGELVAALGALSHVQVPTYFTHVQVLTYFTRVHSTRTC